MTTEKVKKAEMVAERAEFGSLLHFYKEPDNRYSRNTLWYAHKDFVNHSGTEIKSVKEFVEYCKGN